MSARDRLAGRAHGEHDFHRLTWFCVDCGEALERFVDKPSECPGRINPVPHLKSLRWGQELVAEVLGCCFND